MLDDKNVSSRFPVQFFVEFTQFDKVFNISFKKLTKETHPIKSADIYVIDAQTGNPVKHEIEAGDVRAFNLSSKSG